MSHPDFIGAASPISLARLAGDARWPPEADLAKTFDALAALGRAGPSHATVFADGDDPHDLAASRAGACFVAERHVALVPPHMIPLVVNQPMEAARRALTVLYPTGDGDGPIFERRGIDPAAIIHGDAVFERDVSVDPGAVVGPRVEVGTGTTIGANAVVGPGVRIGRGCKVDAQVSIRAALIGDGVTIHAGARIGLDPKKGPRLGRVIVQDGAVIGANAIIERGRLGDTIVGERSQIAALAVVTADALIDREQT